MAARLSPASVSAEHQSLLHFVGQSPWSSQSLLAAVRHAVLPALTMRGPIEAWIVDDTSFPKKGRHSVGVARQYSGQLGKQDNCQVAVSVSVASAEAVCPWPGGCICRSSGARTGSAAQGQGARRDRLPKQAADRA